MSSNEFTGTQIQLPERINRLQDIAYDLWWSSCLEARSVFRSISRHQWWMTEHNPILLLRQAKAERLESLSKDAEFLARYDALISLYENELRRSNRFVHTTHPKIIDKKIAYFSAEYGIHSSLPIYSGGLGVLAGDHIKTAQDMGMPIVAIGFLYPYGYFEQHITTDGKQIAEYRHLAYDHCPLKKVLSSDGTQLVVSLHLDHEKTQLHLRIWQVSVGNVTIYLMDSDLEENAADDRQITQRLYGGDKLYRLRQEIALGVGGVRTLCALGIKPDVWHANEGHASFMFIERLRQDVRGGSTIADAVEHIRATSIFTTHTPVPAGHDSFKPEIVAEYLTEMITEIGISKEDFLGIGKHEEDWGEGFNMTTLAMNMSLRRNAVSLKHRDVTRAMWKNYAGDPIPISSVTNGVHIPTWVSSDLARLFSHAIDPNWKDRLRDNDLWQKIHAIPDPLLWDIRSKQSKLLQRHILDHLRLTQIDESESELITRGAFYNPYAFTIGFARRFATYKRANLLFRDPYRLARILNEASRPVQIIFSGKAHPADEGGKSLIKELWDHANDPLFRGNIIFLENYNMHSAKFLVQGVDLWMNTPRAPMEASGTSGMKAAINGVPNLSVMDGWWCEGYNGKNGWAIEVNNVEDPEMQDEHDANAIYELLEETIVPMYYDRDLNDVPKAWLQVVKESMSSVIPNFTSERMMREYIENLYIPAMKT